MDCGIPFCNNGCPVNNIIPDFNDRCTAGLEVGDRSAAPDQQFPRIHRPHLPGTVRGRLHARHQRAAGGHQVDRARHHRQGLERLGQPQAPKHKTGKTVAVVGSGPAGPAAAQQLARAGHDVTVFEKNDRIGGLLRYGIPDFKMEKSLIDRRIEQMQAEGVTFRAGVMVTDGALPAGIKNYARETISAKALMEQFDAVVLAGGSEVPRDLPVPGRDLSGVHYALEFLIPQNKEVAGDGANEIRAEGKHVIVIGGGDTGSDCVGTSNRHGAISVTQFELLPQPPEEENKPLVWPYWPIKLRTSSSHEEGCERDWSVATKELIGENGKVTGLKACRVEWKDGKMQEVPGSEFTLKADRCCWQWVSPTRWARCWKRSASTPTHARTPRPPPKASGPTRPTWPRCSPPATCVAASPGGVGDPRRPPCRALGRRLPDGALGTAALTPALPLHPTRPAPAGRVFLWGRVPLRRVPPPVRTP